jgi:hypothetical protein
MPKSIPALSVLVPNFNYGRYIGETIQSVLSQADDTVEVAVCDNRSTDDSIAVVKRIADADARVRYSINACNVGFASNLERVATMATGRRMLLLSSDDRMRPGAIAAYAKLAATLGDDADDAVWGSSWSVMDANGVVGERLDPDSKLWRQANDEPVLSAAVGHGVRSLPAPQLLRRSLELLRISLPFLTTCYSRKSHDAVGGYAGGRLMNPDKWFAWKLLAVTKKVYIIDESLFDYRVHAAGQNAQQKASGALKHLTDQYVASFQLSPEVLAAAGITSEQVAAAFVEQDIALRGLAALSEGERTGARRMVRFGQAAYPALVRSNPKIWALRALLAMGPVGTVAARAIRARAEAAWQARESSEPGTVND